MSLMMNIQPAIIDKSDIQSFGFQGLVNQMPGFYYAKALDGRYLFANEEFAHYAFCSSEQQIKNKRDDDLPWKKQAALLQSIDTRVISITGFFQEIVEINHPELGSTQFLTTKKRLLDSSGSTCGVVGMSVNLGSNDDYHKLWSQNNNPICDKRLALGKEFSNQHLTRQEIKVYRTILLGYSAKEGGEQLNISPKTVEFHTEQLRKKLSCHNKGELLRKAHQYGFSNTILNYI